MNFRRSLPALILAVAASLSINVQAQQAAAPAVAPQAEGTVLMKGPGGVITLGQLQSAVQYLVPPSQRESFFSNPRNIEQLALLVYTRQTLAAQAKQKGFNQQPDVAKIASLAEQHTLSDLWLTSQVEAQQPSPQELEQYARSVYDSQPARLQEEVRLKVRHILVAPSKTLDDAQAKAKADQLLAKLKSGSDFETLARAESSDKSSSAKGGELPLIAIGAHVTKFDAAAAALTKPGQLSDVVKTEHGYHIIQLVERQTLSGFERQRAELIEQARAKLASQARSKLLSAAQAGVEPDAAAIAAQVRPPVVEAK